SREFLLALETKADAANFSHYYFPPECSDALVGRTFSKTLVLIDAHFQQDRINLKGVVLNSGCEIACDSISDVILQNAVVAGALMLRFKEVKGILAIDGTTFRHSVDIQADRVAGISGTGIETLFMDRTVIKCQNINQLNLNECRLRNTQLSLGT